MVSWSILSGTRVSLYLYGPLPLIRTPSGIPRSCPASRVCLKAYKPKTVDVMLYKVNGENVHRSISSNTYCVVSYVPVTYQDCDIASWVVKWDRNDGAWVDYESTKSTGCSLKIERGEVEVAPDLIFNLKVVSPVPFWGYWTSSTKNTILPRTPFLLYASPVSREIYTIQSYIFQIRSIYHISIWICEYSLQDFWFNNDVYESYQVRRRSSSNLFLTLTTTLLLVVEFIVGPGNFPFIAITYTI